MGSFINEGKLVQMGICLFGTLSVYLVYGLVYEKIIMSPYQSIESQEREFFASVAGLVLIERGVSWLLAQVFCKLFVKKQEKLQYPLKNEIICGFLTFISALIFTHAVYITSYRLPFAIKSGIYPASTAVGLFYCWILKPSFPGPRFLDMVLSLGITGGAVLFWLYDPQICMYVPIEMKVVALVYLIISCFSDGVVSIFQSQMSHEYKPHMLTLMRDISRWTAVCSLLLVLVLGELPYVINFCVNHARFALDVVLLSVLYFIGQLITYRAITNMPQNSPSYIEASGKTLHVQMSFALSVHKHHFYQLIGFALSWTTIILQALLTSKSSNNQSIKQQKISPSYHDMTQISSEDDHQMDQH